MKFSNDFLPFITFLGSVSDKKYWVTLPIPSVVAIRSPSKFLNLLSGASTISRGCPAINILRRRVQGGAACSRPTLNLKFRTPEIKLWLSSNEKGDGDFVRGNASLVHISYTLLRFLNMTRSRRRCLQCQPPFYMKISRVAEAKRRRSRTEALPGENGIPHDKISSYFEIPNFSW